LIATITFLLFKRFASSSAGKASEVSIAPKKVGRVAEEQTGDIHLVPIQSGL
jgi:hypothetical protein